MLSLIFLIQRMLLCVWGCGQARPWEAAAGQVLQTIKANSPSSGMMGACPIFTTKKCVLLASRAMSHLQLLFPLLRVHCRGSALKDVSAHKQRHLILKLHFWKGIGLHN